MRIYENINCQPTVKECRKFGLMLMIGFPIAGLIWLSIVRLSSEGYKVLLMLLKLLVVGTDVDVTLLVASMEVRIHLLDTLVSNTIKLLNVIL